MPYRKAGIGKSLLLAGTAARWAKAIGTSHACNPAEIMNLMNTSNPFQVPSCLQRADSQQRRRERFKKAFIAAVAAVVILLIGLLIEGCMSEQTTTPAKNVSGLPAPQTRPALVGEEKPTSNPQPALVPTARTVPADADANPVTTARSDSFYVVKAGDNLTRIARLHGTTVKALKAANSLKSDQIVVGARLKIPTA